MKNRIANLCYLVRDGKVLLIRKKRGLGAGKINGPGGGVEKDESPEQSVIREVKEEVGIDINSLQFRGIHEFVNNGKLALLCYVFVSGDFEGEAQETEEAEPLWVDVKEIPYEKMWEDDRHWLPKVLGGKTVFGRFEFEEWKMKNHELFEL